MATSSPAGPPPPPDALPAVTENGNNNHPPRRTSRGFLSRSKSTEPLGDRKSSVKMSKKARKEQAREEELRRQREAAVPQRAPRLPDLPPAPQLKTFGGENARPDSFAIVSNQAGNYNPSHHSVPVPSVPAGVPGLKSGEYVDPYARTESMTHRGRYSYASSAVSTINSPRRVRRRKDPTPYNILVIGARNSGKTSFLNFLRTSLALPPKKRPTRSPDEFDDLPPPSYSKNNFVSHYLETEIDNERVGVTLWDSHGLEPNVVDLQLREITTFLESKFEDTFTEEMKVVRSPGVRDTHIHCAFLVLDPVRLDANIAAAEKAAKGEPTKGNRVVGGLDEDLDIQVIRTMQGKTTVVPIISKADTITTAHMEFLKRTVSESLKKAGLDHLEALSLDDQDDGSSSSLNVFDEQEEDDLKKMEGQEEEEPATPVSPESESETPPVSPEKRAPSSSPRHTKQKSSSSILSANGNPEAPLFPLSILSPDPHSLGANDGPIGRKFPWGFADPYNPDHCDFLKLKESVFNEWRGELREASREVWYERWRTSRLNRNGTGPGNIKVPIRGAGGRATR
ncbi:hypothetical protein AJ80_01584 [Polytolypa hystricis UAMH7299]|uniref:Septin-type G domain-containing protein n=1 Tax=Polytolypa hystricis (strain UAMH7299) TaxID=1447883 RepID=A0A2B7Z075_POLH7|nr:hypothetical protein AJ80_01584 [Polytolypa hystricis UAMH7299]